MKEIDANREAWSLLTEGHYHRFKEALGKRTTLINRIILHELGDVSKKRIIHLQCNTGAEVTVWTSFLKTSIMRIFWPVISTWTPGSSNPTS